MKLVRIVRGHCIDVFLALIYCRTNIQCFPSPKYDHTYAVNDGHRCFICLSFFSSLSQYGNMFSVAGAQQQIVNIDGPPRRQHHSILSEINSEVVQIPPGTQTPAISQIEALLESIVDAVSTGNELVIPYRSIRSSNNEASSQSQHGEDRPPDVVRFPGRTIQEAKRFGTKD